MILRAFVILAVVLHKVVSFNILCIVSLPLKSHYMAFHPLFRELAKCGHNVTIVNNFPQEESNNNIKFVNLQRALRSDNFPSISDFENLNYIHIENLLSHIYLGEHFHVVDDCDALLTDRNLKAHLEGGYKYDVIFVEQFISDCGLVYASAMYDVPIIGITSHVLLPWSYPRLGIPFDLSSDSFYFSYAGPNPSLHDKIESVLMLMYFNTIGRWRLQGSIERAFSRYLPNYSLDIESVARKRIKMMFSYQHYSVTGSRILSPQLLEIGGIHIATPKQVSKDIEEFLANADHGVIYFSFGSNLKSNTMSEKKLQQFLEAFRRIPQKILWKWEDDNFPKGNDNVYTKKWMPQLDVLCHPKVIAFISHGGMLSLSEAAHCGKPMLAIPFFGDQFSNAASIRHVGLGKTILFERIDTENLVAALKEITSPDMQNNAKNISKLWHDRPQNVMDSAIYWTEYVARHGTGPPSMPSKLNTWFENMLLDVYCVFILLFLLIIGLCYSIVKLIKIIIVKLLSLIFVKKAKIQ
ncbi:UDP-glycosyltransferase UGT5-like isoform X2 [Achroia grisella]|uniref:UDP-glycosyltransferase UGT5-like isoform X2 n=1 Tax=Achroia grisella TaxID=688607 RepID=UPI0027D229ED|nr:UDP-glycosyltransferase UGT5-like isoform X2 [Achroia grisella]